MIQIKETNIYIEWFASLKDKKAKAIILARLRRVSLSNFEDVKPVGKGISELKIHYALGTGFISKSLVMSSLSCFVAAIYLSNQKIFGGRTKLPMN